MTAGGELRRLREWVEVRCKRKPINKIVLCVLDFPLKNIGQIADVLSFKYGDEEMLKMKEFLEIKKLKEDGFTKSEVVRMTGLKQFSVRKYWDYSVDDFAEVTS